MPVLAVPTLGDTSEGIKNLGKKDVVRSIGSRVWGDGTKMVSAIAEEGGFGPEREKEENASRWDCLKATGSRYEILRVLDRADMMALRSPAQRPSEG